MGTGIFTVCTAKRHSFEVVLPGLNTRTLDFREARRVFIEAPNAKAFIRTISGRAHLQGEELRGPVARKSPAEGARVKHHNDG
ncbi:hypothetical protein CYMTET_15073 [Cymbomonas tetramitiformis]|uniref:Uncharacterized protein n=1 Tax=Cymbomonas tetramitiformis TaxID=36881 RepID=A0AAE0L9A5_9CHLO|nr:hypothetical protein CYMTET_15073 [Cymbomonas tetramitiformis]